MKAYQATYTIAMLCRVLEVSPSGYYAWCKRRPRRVVKAICFLAIESKHCFANLGRRMVVHAFMRTFAMKVSRYPESVLRG